MSDNGKIDTETAKDNTTSATSTSQYSGISIIVAILLLITLIVFLQFFIGDITETLYGKTPKFTYGNYQNGYIDEATGLIFNDYNEAYAYFTKNQLLPYETKTILISTLINVPLFILAVICIFLRDKFGSWFRIATNTYFASMVVNMLILLSQLATYVYKINQKLAVYGVSFLLIIVFIVSIFYIQEKHRE